MSKPSEPVARRVVMTGALTAGVAAAAVAVVAPNLQPSAPADANPAPKAEPSGQGYRLTEHIQHYYRTARI